MMVRVEMCLSDLYEETFNGRCVCVKACIFNRKFLGIIVSFMELLICLDLLRSESYNNIILLIYTFDCGINKKEN